MRPRQLTGLGARRPDPPVHRCSCGCGGEASLGYPFGRWYVPGHVPPEIAAPPAVPRRAEPAQPPADLFEAAGVPARRASRPLRRPS